MRPRDGFVVAVSTLGLATLSLAATAVRAVDFTGSVGVEGRWFPAAPQFPGQLAGLQPSLFAEPSLEFEVDDDQFSIVPYARLDGRDDVRTHVDVREAYWRHLGEGFEVTIGINRVFWGVTESRHLVNTINQIDQIESPDEEDFLGQPMVAAATQTSIGRFEAFVLPYFRERTVAGKDGRLRAPLPIDRDGATYDSSLKRWHPDVALRYTHVIGDWDIGAHAFHGTGREPRLLLDGGGTALVPHYDTVTQAGLDLQYTTGAWLWKFEGLVRAGQGDTFAAMVGGFEYTLFQVTDEGADLGLLAEYLFDGRDQGIGFDTPFNNDVFLAARFALNDIQDTSILAGAVIDLEDGATSIRVEGQRRLGTSWKVEVEAQMFLNVDEDNALAAVEDDHFLTVRLTRFF